MPNALAYAYADEATGSTTGFVEKAKVDRLRLVEPRIRLRASPDDEGLVAIVDLSRSHSVDVIKCDWRKIEPA